MAVTPRETPPWLRPRRRFQLLVTRLMVHLFGWVGLATLLYIGFSFLFDTPVEYRLKQSTAMLREQYKQLNLRYDTLNEVLQNVVERDRNVFKTLFEAEPYTFDSQFEAERLATYEKLLTKTNKELGKDFFNKTSALDKNIGRLRISYDRLAEGIESALETADEIPAIQPVINKDLTLLTASYGLRIHPFYKTLTPHHGVDYTVPEGSRVFATADGTVKDISSRNTSSGLTVTLAHGNGYETSYSHLSRANVKKGETVRRGDIIALTGNTGLSLAPHLHYEVRHNGLRVDPIHYFFMELSPAQYQRIMRIAQSGMQSFD